MHHQSTSPATLDLDALVAGLPLTGRVRRATTVCCGLSYARVSKSIQTSIPAQQERIASLARRYGVPVELELTDTRSGMRADRQGYQQLLAAARTERYSHVFLYRADRLARDSEELIRTVKGLWRLGVTVIDTSVGEITPQNLNLLALIAENEIRMLSERTDMGLRAHAANGSKVGAVPTGYLPSGVKGRPDVDPIMAPLVAELFHRAARGEAVNALRRWFNDASGRSVDNHTIRGMLRNPYYMGLNVNFRSRRSIVEGARAYARPQDEWTKGRHDQAIVDERTWLRVQAQLDKHANVGQHRERVSAYALQGLLHCARCGRRMQGRTKEQWRTYRCPLCNMERGLVKVERAVRACLSRIQLDAGAAATVLEDMLAEQRATFDEQLADARQRIAALTKKRMRIYERWDDGKIDQEQYAQQIAEVDAQRTQWHEQEAKLTAQLAAQPQAAGLVSEVAADPESWLYWPEKIPAMSIEHQQNVYRECVKAARLDAAAETLTVEYTPHIALVMGRATHTVSLPSQKAR